MMMSLHSDLPTTAGERLALALCRVNAGTFAEIAASTGVDPFRIMDLWAAEMRRDTPVS